MIERVDIGTREKNRGRGMRSRGCEDEIGIHVYDLSGPSWMYFVQSIQYNDVCTSYIQYNDLVVQGRFRGTHVRITGCRSPPCVSLLRCLGPLSLSLLPHPPPPSSTMIGRSVRLSFYFLRGDEPTITWGSPAFDVALQEPHTLKIAALTVLRPSPLDARSRSLTTA